MINTLEDIQKKAIELEPIADNEQLLFQKLNSLSTDSLKTALSSYKRDYFKPVNFLRSEIAQKLLNKEEVTAETVEEIEDKIVKRDKAYFSKYGTELLKSMEDYPERKRSFFNSWQNFSILFPFFYTDKEKEDTNKALEELCLKLISDLNLKNYKYHYVDFWGPQNFGQPFCWLALYPAKRGSHKNAYQLFMCIKVASTT